MFNTSADLTASVLGFTPRGPTNVLAKDGLVRLGRCVMDSVMDRGSMMNCMMDSMMNRSRDGVDGVMDRGGGDWLIVHRSQGGGAAIQSRVN